MTVKLTEAQKKKILNADDVFSVMQQVLLREKKIDRNKEHFWLVCLSASHQILMIELISLGSVNKTIAEPMDIFSFALQKRAVKIIMVHNHPSGELHPSQPDKDITTKMIVIGKFLQLPVVDHLIISEKDFYSFAASGLMAKLDDRNNVDLTFKKQEAQQKQLRDQKIKTAKTLLKSGISIETIIKASGLSLTEIEALMPKKKK